jgi:uncharacterized membrane protein
MFSFVSLAGLGLILYAILANRKPAVAEDTPLGFSDE